METISGYLKYYKDKTFNETPFNDVDSAIFSSLAYLDFDNIVNKDITIKETGEKYFETFDIRSLKTLPIIVKKTVENFRIVYNSERYKNVILSNYIKIVDSEKQFCALTYKMPGNFIYIAYEGTDDSLIGWQEDFEMIYKFPVPAQALATRYINQVVKLNTKRVIVGGHSKGGNLAMTAFMYCKPHIKRKVETVYNFDGPGFRKSQIESKEYKQLLLKLKMFVPEQSVVGFILRHPEDYYVVKSSGKGLFQHNINNWNCYGTVFIPGTLSDNSKSIESRILYWLNNHDDEKRKIFVKTVFDTFRNSDISKFSQLRKLNIAKAIKLIRASRRIDKESKDLVLSAIKIILFGDKDEIIE